MLGSSTDDFNIVFLAPATRCGIGSSWLTGSQAAFPPGVMVRQHVTITTKCMSPYDRNVHRISRYLKFSNGSMKDELPPSFSTPPPASEADYRVDPRSEIDQLTSLPAKRQGRGRHSPRARRRERAPSFQSRSTGPRVAGPVFRSLMNFGLETYRFRPGR